MMPFRAAVKRLFVLALASSACTFSLWAIAPSATETAVANGDTRTIHFYHTHTGESIDATFRVDGHYDQAVLNKLNYFLRDWRNNDQTVMDPRLFDTLWEVYRTAEAGDTPIQIYSAYRSPETNAMLRRRSRAVAEHSQHMLGKAMDTTMPGMPMEKIREIGMKLQRGGVGYYQSANFVHLDVGGVRSWPRMSYDQLARLFPDGKTVHIPSNGVPMPRYEEARAEIAAHGGIEVPPAQESQGFFAWLFGGNNGRRDDSAPSGAHAPVVMAYANNTEGDEATNERAPALAAKAPPPAQKAPLPAPVAQAAPQAPQPVQSVVAITDPVQDTSVPLPPRRPMALMVASLDGDLPLPPVRRDTQGGFRLASVDDDPVPAPLPRPAAVPDAIGGLIGTTSAGPANGEAAVVHKSAALPEIITQGTAPRVLPSPVLAFAAPETTASVRPADPQPVTVAALPAHTNPSPKTLGLRGIAGLHNEAIVVKKLAAAALLAPVHEPFLAGPAIYGLRKAAQNPVLAAAR